VINPEEKMTTEIEKAIDVLVQNFLLDAEQSMESVTGALSAISAENNFADLGQAVFTAMLQAHTARLGSTRATLTAKGPKRNIH
jgi:hypothetical protein